MTILYLLAVFAFCFVLERLIPGWPLPQVKTWPLRVVAVNLVQIGIVLLAGVTWERWLSSASLFKLEDYVSPVAGGFIAYFIATFIFYWWHRWRHENDTLWRIFHQIHHSPQRLEVITSFYKHPVEMIVNSIIGSLLVYATLGLSLEGGAVFFFQRPEMHRIHHQYERHKNNYGDITWWDMLFGTYENPKEWTHTCGFDDENEQRLGAMLACKDVRRQGAHS
jgi:sterol desaturase/sphingolipid hydroxylase (fatty acid hydroxylase superfamily)